MKKALEKVDLDWLLNLQKLVEEVVNKRLADEYMEIKCQ